MTVFSKPTKPWISPLPNERLEQALAGLRSGAAPVPNEEEIFVGRGPYLDISAEFLHYFVAVGGLEPHHTVLDIGSGIGRISAGLSLFLDPVKGRYIGFDPVIEGVEWCRKAYTDRPNFRFEWIDLYNELYRPDGTILSTDFSFPAEDRSVDFAILTSVFTHLYEPEIAAYFRELTRVLKPNGRIFATAFLYDGAVPFQSDLPHLHFDRQDERNASRWHVEGYPPLAAVCYAESYFANLVRETTGRSADIRKGQWRGGPGPWSQDLILI
jgi:SAM-dependent methyltransferase